MKSITTSYLNRRVNWREQGYTRARICRWVVHQSQHERYDLAYPELYPPEHMIKNFSQFTTTQEWEAAYTTEVLDKLNPHKFYDAMPDKCVLMCHEKSETDGSVICHRRLVAQWLMTNCDVVVPEWLPPDQLAEIELANKKAEHTTTLLDF